MSATNVYKKQVLAELDALPEEYLPYVLQLMKTFKESVSLKSAKASFEQGWKEAKQGETYPIEELWEGIDIE
ncbi:MAG: hypothetical protein JNM06_02065 [Blastocatellia bacterium]|nr:hypothetical protein [Blastocatellia bacterium]